MRALVGGYDGELAMVGLFRIEGDIFMERSESVVWFDTLEDVWLKFSSNEST